MNIDIILKQNKYKNLLNEIENDKEKTNNGNESNQEKICLISQVPIIENIREITLPCGHTFDYVNLYNEIKNQKYYFYKVEYNNMGTKCIKCPYCRKVHDGILPFHEIDKVERIKWINQPNSSMLPIHKCGWVYQSGKNKGKQCTCSANMYKIGAYCEKHYKIMKKNENKTNNNDDSVNRCQAILKSGKNKGHLCNCKVHTDGVMFCKRHIKNNT